MVENGLVGLGGSLADYLAYSTPHDNGAEKWERHEYRKAGDDYVVKHQGETYLAPDECVHHQTGELYSMDAMRLHRIYRRLSLWRPSW